jgi:hypothetical protein
MGCGETHFVCPQITRLVAPQQGEGGIALISKMKNYFALINLFTSEEIIGEINRTVTLLSPKSATASRSAIGSMISGGVSFVGVSPNLPSM